jgi:hypothetical protein
VKLYVCWGTFAMGPHRHPCRTAHQALLTAGHEPEVIKVYGLGAGPRVLQWTTDGRRKVEELSGQKAVPVLIADDGEVIAESARIVEWAAAQAESAASSAS